MSDLATHLDALAATRAETLNALAGLTEEQLNRPLRWRGGPLDLRFLLLQIADTDDARRVSLERALAAAGWEPTAVQRVLAGAVRSRGRTLGALVGMPDVLLDLAPAPEEWPLRLVLGHILNTEHRYALHSGYAAERMARGGEGPVRIPDEPLPPLTPQGIVAPEGSAGGALTAVRRELLAGMTATLEQLAAISDEYLTAPTVWVGIDLDLRFRLHRFAAHERQHLVQVWKTAQALGFAQSEAQMILAEAELARAELLALLVGVPDERAGRRRDGQPSALDLLAEAERQERDLVAQINAALS